MHLLLMHGCTFGFSLTHKGLFRVFHLVDFIPDFPTQPQRALCHFLGANKGSFTFRPIWKPWHYRANKNIYIFSAALNIHKGLPQQLALPVWFGSVFMLDAFPDTTLMGFVFSSRVELLFKLILIIWVDWFHAKISLCYFPRLFISKQY